MYLSNKPPFLSVYGVVGRTREKFTNHEAQPRSLQDRMINLFLFCDQVADSHENLQKVRLNQSESLKLNDLPVRRAKSKTDFSMIEHNGTENSSRD